MASSIGGHAFFVFGHLGFIFFQALYEGAVGALECTVGFGILGFAGQILYVAVFPFPGFVGTLIFFEQFGSVIDVSRLFLVLGKLKEEVAQLIEIFFHGAVKAEVFGDREVLHGELPVIDIEGIILDPVDLCGCFRIVFFDDRPHGVSDIDEGLIAFGELAFGIVELLGSLIKFLFRTGELSAHLVEGLLAFVELGFAVFQLCIGRSELLLILCDLGLVLVEQFSCLVELGLCLIEFCLVLIYGIVHLADDLVIAKLCPCIRDVFDAFLFGSDAVKIRIRESISFLGIGEAHFDAGVTVIVAVFFFIEDRSVDQNIVVAGIVHQLGNVVGVDADAADSEDVLFQIRGLIGIQDIADLHA